MANGAGHPEDQALDGLAPVVTGAWMLGWGRAALVLGDVRGLASGAGPGPREAFRAKEGEEGGELGEGQVQFVEASEPLAELLAVLEDQAQHLVGCQIEGAGEEVLFGLVRTEVWCCGPERGASRTPPPTRQVYR
jgi:hypothetical protein